MVEILRLVWIFVKIGAFTFGGGYAMIPMIRSEMVAYGLMTLNEVADVVAISQMTPGPFSVNAATFAGVRTAGIPGGVAATLAVMLPSFVLSILAVRFFMRFQNHCLVQGALTVLRPAVTGLIAASAVAMIAPAVLNAPSFAAIGFDRLLTSVDIPALVIAAASGVAVIGFKAPPVPVILAAGVAGVLAYAVI